MSASYVSLHRLRMNTLPEVQQEPSRHVDHLQEYKDIFLKVKNWGKLEESDIERNQIEEAQYVMTIPNFVATFERKLVRKPRLPPMCAVSSICPSALRF